MAGLVFVSGAAVIHFDLGPAGFLRKAFVGGATCFAQRDDRPTPEADLNAATVTVDRSELAEPGLTLIATTHATEARLMDHAGRVVHLTPADGLRSPAVDYGDYTPPELLMFAESFGKSVTGWSLAPAPEVIQLAFGAWVPDFALVHDKRGAVAPLEILGFWRRTNADALYRRLAAENPGPFVLALSAQNRVDDGEDAQAGNVSSSKRTSLPLQGY